MTARKLGAEALLDLVAEVLRNEITPVLPAEKRYAAAMAANAVDIARREIAGEAEVAEFQLLDAVYDDGDGTMERLARDIRAGAVSQQTHPDLLRLLRANLVAELKVRNPRAVASRKA
jgi:hypothetical protein